MKAWLRSLKKHLKIYLIFLKMNLVAQMEFRINFITNILVEMGYLLAKALYVIVIYRTGVQINGMSADAVLIFIGTYTLMTGLYMGLFFINFIHFSEMVGNGDLDLLIPRPVSTLFMATLRYFNFGLPIPNLIGGIAMICIGWKRLGVSCDPAHVAGFALASVSGIVMIYALFLLPQLLCFMAIKMRGINELSNALWDLNNMPMGIYPEKIQRAGTLVIPIFLISNFSPLLVMGKLSPIEQIWGFCAPFLLLAITIFFWRKSIKHYSSAGG
ncbi:MAG: ABC-2 family transporter protein [Oligoflexales bacterium]|nr:ABC-2 family transporter protein [Oligoflexales bacterium]